MLLTILAIAAILFHTYYCMNLASPPSLRAKWWYFPILRTLVTLVDLSGAYAMGLTAFRFGRWTGVGISVAFFFVIWPLFWFVLSMRRLSKFQEKRDSEKETGRTAAKRSGRSSHHASPAAKKKVPALPKRSDPAKALAELISSSVEDNVSQDFIRAKFPSSSAAERARFCFSLANLISVIWWVNKLEKDRSKQERILDGLLEEYMSLFKNDPTHFQIKDMIPWIEEQRYLATNFRIAKTNMSNYRTIMPIIYEYRLGPYYEAMEKIAAASAKGKVTFSVDPVTKLFLLHSTGKHEIDDFEHAIKLSVYLLPRQLALVESVRARLKTSIKSSGEQSRKRRT